MADIFNTVSPYDMTGNVFNRVGREWMLITAGGASDFNTMTAGWGTFGVLWGKNVATVFVRDHRHTFKFTEKYDRFTLSFFGGEQKEALKILGTLSGRDVNKVEKAGLTPVHGDKDITWFEEAEMVVVCRKLYRHKLNPYELVDDSITEIYPLNDYHYMYIGEIEEIMVKE